MAVTVTRLSKIPKMQIGGGCTRVAVSIKFDTNYAATGGEVIGAAMKTVTLLPTKIFALYPIGKMPMKTTAPFFVQFAPGTNFKTTTAAIKLYRWFTSSTATSAGLAILRECSTTNDLSTVSIQAMLEGY